MEFLDGKQQQWQCSFSNCELHERLGGNNGIRTPKPETREPLKSRAHMKVNLLFALQAALPHNKPAQTSNNSVSYKEFVENYFRARACKTFASHVAAYRRRVCQRERCTGDLFSSQESSF